MSSGSVGHYLAGMSESIVRQQEHSPFGRFPFITISRQTGAGGQSLAEELLAQIKSIGDEASQGWAIFSEAMCNSILDDPHLGSTLKDLLEEHYRSPVQEFVHELIGNPAQDLGYAKLAQIIKDVASLGKVIVVGRGASSVTRQLPLGVHVRLVAPLTVRQQRMENLLEVDHSAAAAEIEKCDRERQKLLKKHFGEQIDDPENYDAVWNTSRVPLAHIAQVTLQLVRERSEEHLRLARQATT